MIDLLKFILTNAAIAFIISQSKIFHPLRMYAKNNSVWSYEFMICCLCCGFWSSTIAWASVYLQYFFLNIFSYCCIGSITAYITYKLIKKL